MGRDQLASAICDRQGCLTILFSKAAPNVASNAGDRPHAREVGLHAGVSALYDEPVGTGRLSGPASPTFGPRT